MLVRASSEKRVGLCITVLLDDGEEDVQSEWMVENIGSANPQPGYPPSVRCAFSVRNFQKIRERFPGAKIDLGHESTVTLVNKLKEDQRAYDLESKYGELVKMGEVRQIQHLLPNYEFKLPPFEHQIVGWQFLHVMKNPALFGDCGIGKFLDRLTPILTPTGWRAIQDIRVKDSVIARDGKPYPVTAIYPQGEKALFRVTFNDGASILAGGEHLWLAKTFNDSQRNKGWRVVSTDEMLEAGLTYGSDRKSYRWRIPLVAPVDFPEKDLPIHPYVLGVLLGDGSITQGTPSWCKNDPEIAVRVEGLLPPHCTVGETKTASDRGRQWSITAKGMKGNPVTDSLKGLHLFGRRSSEKFIPTPYLMASIDQRLELLRGLLDTDGGACSSSSTSEYSSASKDLAEGVQFLVQSLGGKASLSGPRITSFTHNGKKKSGRPSYRVFFSLPPSIQPFTITRKLSTRTRPIVRTVTSIEPETTAEAICISVDSPDRTYVCNDFIVTHNTYIAGTWADSLIKSDQPFVFLVICPVNIIKHAWMADLAKFTDLRPVRLHEPSSYKRKEKRAARFATDGDIYIINPESLLRQEKEVRALIRRHMRKGKQFALVIDESSRIKNSKSKVFKVIKTLRPLAERTVIMTGTPAPNGIGDLWAQFAILDEGLTLQPKYRDYRQDTHVHFNMKGVNYTIGTGKNAKVVPVLHWRPRAQIAPTVYKWIKPRMVRFRAEDCVDLPDKQFLRRDIVMTKEQTKAYNEMRDYLYTEFEGEDITARVAAVRMMKLREITGGFIITDKPNRSTKPLNKETPKMLELDHLLEDVVGKRLGDEERAPTKALIWAQYQWECQTLNRRYKKYGARGLYGGISQTAKDDNIDAFKNDPSCQVLVCHPKSAGHGLTLTEANYSFYYSLSYDYDEFYQSARRIARPGQTRPMFFYFLVAPGTIDEIILAALEDKKNIADVVTDGPFNRGQFDSLIPSSTSQLNMDLEART